MRRDRGQGTVEYILMLSIATLIGMLVLRDLVRPAMEKFSNYVSRKMEDSLFKKADMHRYRR